MDIPIKISFIILCYRYQHTKRKQEGEAERKYPHFISSHLGDQSESIQFLLKSTSQYILGKEIQFNFK
jgi:hypothetical protein